VNGAGFNGSSVTTQGTNLINVTVPGQGSKQVIDLVGTTALLRFRQVLLEAQNYTATTSAKVTPAGAGSGAHGLAASAKSLTSGTAAAKAEPKANASPSPSASATPSPSASASPSPSPSSNGKTSEKLSTTADGQGDASALSAKTKALFNKVNCADSNWKTKIYGKNPNNYDNTGTQVVTCYQGLKYALGKAIVTGSQLKLGGSSAVLQSNGNWYVDLNFNGEGTKAFATFTSDLFSKYAGSSTEPLNYFAVVLDGAPASVAYISSAITTGSGQIEGNFTEAQADQLVNVLNYGALPLAFQEQSQQTVSAELGSTQLQAGLLAGAVGLFLVVV
jgi:preprotein translocase subunit SecD